MTSEFHISYCLDFLQNANIYIYENSLLRYVEQDKTKNLSCKIPLFKVFDKQNV